MPLRELKRQQTRDALFDAAVALFADAGYDATTMDEIAEQATVSRATAFKYFPKKEDLLLEWAARRRETIAKQIDAAHEERGDPQQIREVILALAASYTSNRAGRRFVEAWLSIGGPLKPEAWASAPLLGDLIRRGQAAGAIRADVDPQATGRVLLNLFFGALYQWVAQERPGSWLRKELNGALDVALEGLSPT